MSLEMAERKDHVTWRKVNKNHQTEKRGEKNLEKKEQRPSYLKENKQSNTHVIQENRELMEQKIFKKLLAEFD